MLRTIFVMILGFFLLVKGADFLVDGAEDLAKKFHLSEMMIGILIVGIGTSLPEIIVTIYSAIEGKSDILLGNGIGSTICNSLLVIGIASICKPVKIDERILKIHLPISILSIILLTIFCNLGKGFNQITRIESVFLIIYTIGYILYTIYESRQETKELEEEKSNKKSNLKIFILVLIGIVFLKYGADFVVNSATKIANDLNISEGVISITIVAVGTALPEIITSIIAAINKKSDLALGNIIGSNIFNICLLPGIGGLINPIKFDTSFNISLVFLLLIVIEMVIIQKLDKKYLIERKKGVALGLIYVLYTVKLFVTG